MPDDGWIESDRYDILPLESHGHEDFHGWVFHFQRSPGRKSTNTNHAAQKMTAQERTVSILNDRQLNASEPFAASPVIPPDVCCFTEAGMEQITWLFNESKYDHYGLGFTKDLLIGKGGGPVLPVRGDEWHHVQGWPDELRGRAIRYWPGATSTSADSYLPTRISSRSDFNWEREWRLVGRLTFTPTDVGIVIVPNSLARQQILDQVTDAEMLHHLSEIRWFSDSSGEWQEVTD